MAQKIWKSKRAGELDETPEAPNYAVYFMLVAIIIALSAVVLVVAVSSYQVETTSILGSLESAVVEFRLLNSPECFIYQDQTTKRSYPHVIDLGKFTDERASKCISPMSAVCLKTELYTGGNIVSMVQSPNYGAPEEIKVALWPVRIKNKDEERQGFMKISTSKRCGR